MDAETFADAGRAFCDAVFGGLASSLDPDARYVLERSPNHAERLDLVAQLYPDARVVHIIRDGRDVARSLVAQNWGPDDLRAAARRWRRAVETARRAGPAFAVYAEVRYEDLLGDPRRIYTDLLAKLGLTAHTETVDTALAEAGRAANVDSSQPRIAHGKWQNVWSPADLAAFESEAGDLLYGQLGYPRLPATGHPPTAAKRAARVGRRALSRLRPDADTEPSDDTAVDAATVIRDNPNAVRVCDDLVSMLSTKQLDRIGDQLAADVLVRVVTPDGTSEARGPDGARLLAETMRGEGEWGKQLRGDVFPAEPSITMALRHDNGTTVVDRLLVLRARGWSITRIDYYRLGEVDAHA
jgi:hypothetical protein